MAEFQVKLGVVFTPEDGGPARRDVDLLESFGQHIEAIAGEMGPATAITGDHYIALFTVEAETPLEAAQRAADVFNDAMTRAFADRGDEIDEPLFARYFEQLH